jgi:hypothetical protein
MRLDRSSLILIASILLFMVTYFKLKEIRDEVNDRKSYLMNFERESKDLIKLKRKFDDKSVQNRVISTLNRISTPAKDMKKGDSRVLVYENLSPTSLNQFLRKLQNSTLKIKRVEIDRLSQTNATVKLEIKR